MHVRRATAALAAALALLVGTACEDEPEPQVADPTETPSSSEPTSDAPSEPVEPVLPEAAAASGEVGAVAFVRYYWALVDYAQRSGDTSALANAALPNCDPCLAGTQGVDRVFAVGGRFVGGGYRTESLSAGPLSTEPVPVFQVQVTVRNSRQEVVEAGELNAVFPASSVRYNFVVAMNEDRWQVSDFRRRV